MDVIKIGKFIAECRKNKNLTQAELAEKLCITDRAVSKWECGKSLPDSSIMLDLCEILGISINELLSGEVLEMKEYNKQADLNLLEMKKQKEEADKRLLTIEIVMMIVSIIFLFSLVIVGNILVKRNVFENWIFFLMFGFGLLQFIICGLFAFKIEQKAGYYECQKCKNRYVPTYTQICFSAHMGRTRYLTCPKCKQKSWNKKLLSDE